MIGAGKRNRIVNIERQIDLPDGQGGFDRDWAVVGRAYVDARPTGGREALVAGTLQQEQPWTIEMPWRADLTPKDRLTAAWLPEGFAIAVQSVSDPEGQNRRLVVLGTASRM